MAVQTGCEILVKMKDITDPSDSQYYATGSLKKSYNNNVLRREPVERCVSGETGLPAVDQSIQMGDNISVGFMDNIGVSSGSHTSAVPMHITATNEASNQIDSSCGESEDTSIQIKSEMFEPCEETDESLMTDPGGGGQLEYSMEDSGTTSDPIDTTSQMAPLFQAIPSGLSMIGRQSKSAKYHIPMTPKPYQCGVCHKAFRSVQVLQKHTQTFHMRSSGSARGRGRGGSHLQHGNKSLVYKQQTQQALVSRQAELQGQR